MLGEMRGGNIRADLDALSSCKLAGFCAFTKLIDKEVLVTLPEKWLREEMKISLTNLPVTANLSCMEHPIPTTLCGFSCPGHRRTSMAFLERLLLNIRNA